MTIISQAAIEAAARALDPEVWADDMPISTRDDVVAFHARRNTSCQIARTAILAALPHLGEPVAWQYLDGSGCWRQCPAEVVASYRQTGSIVRPLYLSPPTPTTPASWPVTISELAGQLLVELGYGASPSMEPGADPRRDRIAAMIFAALQGRHHLQRVVDLVIAARAVAYSVDASNEQDRDRLKALDKALEAFVEMVTWDDDPNDTKEGADHG